MNIKNEYPRITDMSIIYTAC